MNHFLEFDQKDALVQPLQGRDLGQVEALVPGGGLPFHLLDGHQLLVVAVNAFDNGTVGTLT